LQPEIPPSIDEELAEDMSLQGYSTGQSGFVKCVEGGHA